MQRLLLAVLFALCIRPASAETPGLSAEQLAAKMADALEDGDAAARVRMKSGDGNVLQVQIKSRRADGRVTTVYEVLWPADRKGEKVFLAQTAGSWPEGKTVSASGRRGEIRRAEMGEGLLGTDLSYADAVENFFLWPKQQFAGAEKVDGVECVILESRPDGGSPHGKVRSWVDAGRSVVRRVEKYDTAGKLLRTITTTQVAKDDIGRNVPAGLAVTRAGGSSTEIDGSNIRHDVEFTAADLSP